MNLFKIIFFLFRIFTEAVLVILKSTLTQIRHLILRRVQSTLHVKWPMYFLPPPILREKHQRFVSIRVKIREEYYDES